MVKVSGSIIIVLKKWVALVPRTYNSDAHAITTTHQIADTGILGSKTQHNNPQSEESDTAYTEGESPGPTEHKNRSGEAEYSTQRP